MSIITLDIGGLQTVKTLRSTFDQSPVLKAQFAKHAINNDEYKENFFIDKDPELFKIVLEYLRSGQIINNKFKQDVLVQLFEFYFLELAEDMIKQIFEIKSFNEQYFTGNKIVNFTETMISEITGIFFEQIPDTYKIAGGCETKTINTENIKMCRCGPNVGIVKLKQIKHDVLSEIKKRYDENSKTCLKISNFNLIDYDNIKLYFPNETALFHKAGLIEIGLIIHTTNNTPKKVTVLFSNEKPYKLLSMTNIKSETFSLVVHNFMAKHFNATSNNFFQLFNDYVIAIMVGVTTSDNKLLNSHLQSLEFETLYLLKINKQSFLIDLETDNVIEIGNVKFIKGKYYWQLSLP